jgi:hypothetical protein
VLKTGPHGLHARAQPLRVVASSPLWLFP